MDTVYQLSTAEADALLYGRDGYLTQEILGGIQLSAVHESGIFDEGWMSCV
jgi:hypothetical protein